MLHFGISEYELLTSHVPIATKMHFRGNDCLSYFSVVHRLSGNVINQYLRIIDIHEQVAHDRCAATSTKGLEWTTISDVFSTRSPESAGRRYQMGPLIS